jgi:hypothetical protein
MKSLSAASFIFILFWSVNVFSQTLTVNANNPIGGITKTAFSTTSGQFDAQVNHWSNESFQTLTNFGGYFRIALKGNMSVAEQSAITNTIAYSLSKGREPIISFDFDTSSNAIPINQIANTLAFLQPFFNNNTIKWFEIGNETWNYYTGSFSGRVSSYATDVGACMAQIKQRQPNAKFIVCSIEGSYAYPIGNDPCRWTKELLDNLFASNNVVHAVAFHLYPALSSTVSISAYRLLSTGAVLDSNYKTPFSSNYGSSTGLVNMLKTQAIGNRSVQIFCTEFTQHPDLPLQNGLRKGFGNALIYASTFCYLANRNVGLFALHQLGQGDPADTSAWRFSQGYNAVNNSNRLIPSALALELLSSLKNNVVQTTVSGVPTFTTVGNALNDTTGSLQGLSNIPYVTSVASKNATGDTLTIAVVNMSATVVNMNINVTGFTVQNRFRCSMQGASLFTSNTTADSVQISSLQPITSLTSVPIQGLSINLFVLTSGTASTKSESGIKNSYNLNQNYPNPFNPITVISYQLPVNSLITLKVYDVLGREVATLVNERKAAGSYTATFDASKFSSGVYFYKLQSGSFVQTKKMLLVK